MDSEDRAAEDLGGRAESEWISSRLQELLGWQPAVAPQVLEDTTDFMAIDRGHLIRLGGELFAVTATARESRFGLTGEPKHWVKRAVALSSGERVILKLVFHETFRAEIGPRSYLCRRSADKEARVLEEMRGDPSFMQGRGVRDARGNLVRVLDLIRGTTLFEELAGLAGDHEAYIRTSFREVLGGVVEALRAIARLHATGLCHGDIRNDHLYRERATGRLRWIDFDLDQGTTEFDLWSVGNILHFVVAGRIVRIREVLDRHPELAGRVTHADASLFFPYRLMSLGKLFPYLPCGLEAILDRFAVGGTSRYGSVSEVVADLESLSVPTAD